MLNVVCIGGFGHAVSVFDEMAGMEGVQLVGLAPAYPGEDLGAFTSHPLCSDIPVYADPPAMLRETRPDVAIVSTRLDLIPECVIMAANAGCHVIAEKPLAEDLETLQVVRDCVTRNRVRLTAMLTMRNEPEIIAARQLCMSGRIGAPVLINCRKSYKYGIRPAWFGDSRCYSGTLSWVGIHAFDCINFVTGLEIGAVQAMAGNFNHPDLPDCDDNCAVIGRIGNGGHFTASIDLMRPENAATHGDDWLRVVGTLGIIEARTSDHSCTVHLDGKAPVPVALPQRGSIFRDFLQSLQGGDDETFEMESFLLSEASLRAQQSLTTPLYP